MMRVRFVGNHSGLHCGCQAVVDVFRTFYHDHEWVGDDQEYDAIIVNGEGTMHHGWPGYHAKMQHLASAVLDGKQAYLLNSLWQQNDHVYDAVLARLNVVQVREDLSAAEITAHGIGAEVMPDLSWFAAVRNDEAAPDWSGKIVMTDFFLPDSNTWGVPDHLQDMVYVDMSRLSWSALVNGLKTAKLLVTGRHHAIYAACRAACPFVPVSSNSHKIEGLMVSADVVIPTFRYAPVAIDALAYMERHAMAYADLFA